MSVTAQPVLLGDLDTRRPLRASGGRISLRGWCVTAGHASPPEVRLAGENFTLAATTRESRPDVAGQLPGEPAAATSGFAIDGLMPAGVHLARLEARLPDGRWVAFRHYSIAAETPPLVAGIDVPAAGTAVTSRVHVEGWALDPAAPLTALTVRYGHQELPCALERPRTDVPAAFPAIPHAAQTGFKSRVILSAGRGSLRLKALRADGTVAIMRTDRTVAIAHDENVGKEIDLAALRIPLPLAPARTRSTPPVPAARPLNVLFVLYGSFDSNSALHVAALADELQSAGHVCAVAVPHDASTLARLRGARFRGLSHDDVRHDATFLDGRGPDLIHAWTTRENVRSLTETLRARHGSRVVVHLEDNEQRLLAHRLGRTAAELAALSTSELDRLVPADLSHPHRSREFLAAADGVTVITETLQEFVPPGRRSLVVRPAADERYFFPRPPAEAFRRLLLRQPGETILCYHGNVHATNAAEMRELYTAVLRLNEANQPTLLLRTGRDTVDFLGDLAPRIAPHVVALGPVTHHHHLPALLALADFFVQPGWDDAFNHYRFPSKLPEFFALGRPVILPRSNLGTLVRPDIDALVLERADAAGIAGAVTLLRHDAGLRERLARGAAAFATEHFSWHRSAAALAKFYEELAP